MWISGLAYGHTPDLTGTWGEKCLSIDGTEAHYRADHVFNDPHTTTTDQMVTTLSLFFGKECQQRFRSKVYVSKYSIGEAHGEGLKFDAAISHILLTSFAPKDVEMMNIVNHCGYNDWQVGVAKLVDDRRCNANRSAGFVDLPTLGYYTIIGFKETDDGKPYLLFGKFSDEEDESSEAHRPTTLDTTRKFMRR